MALSRALVFESAVAYNVTSWPRATSPSVSSDVIVSTDPDLGGGMVVATGAMWAILIVLRLYHRHGLSLRVFVMSRQSRTRDLQQLGQHARRVEVLARHLHRVAGVPIVVGVDPFDAGDRFFGRGEGEETFA